MSVEALKNFCTQLNLSTEGNKADLIECLICASGLPQEEQNSLEGNIEDKLFENIQDEEDANHKDAFCCRSPTFSTSPKLTSDVEACKKRSKRIKREFRDTADIKALLQKIKHLREDVNSISERVKVSSLRSEIHRNWPDVKFERARDQFEYNALCAIGNDLDLALSATTGEEAIHHIESARTRMLDRMVVLNVAHEYGWEVAVELPQSKNEELSAYGPMIGQSLRTNHTENKNPVLQSEKETDLLVQKEEETNRQMAFQEEAE
ncbi:17148_t:CDS:2 [Cetraspora pellucida]|uniref:17148_t:CDS:1 n=1 Tax=Cetraspora pellucida TaxID=1433469 RepID=A0ACA9L8H3_9GLOM|nr:17148_t:CDS:2 [Cetraspora pellucida]